MDKLQLETNLRVEQARKTELTRQVPQAATAAAAVKSERMLEIERDIRNLEDALNVALQKYTEAHPDVQNIRSRLELAKRAKAADPEGRGRSQARRPPAAAPPR